MKTKEDYPIDAVVLWVDGSDLLWQEKRKKYEPLDGDNNSIQRYRDWGFFKYWFRSIEENAPWINKIYLVTDNQIPDFLNQSSKKLVIVNHSDFIKKDYLPTFNANAIEINIHNIKGLSEHFIYFNDDTFINAKLKRESFFKKGLPRYAYIERNNHKKSTYMDYVVSNDMEIVNRHFSRKQILYHPFRFINIRYKKYGIKNVFMIKEKSFCRLLDEHLPVPLLKSSFSEIWRLEESICDKTSSHKFRQKDDINQYVFRYWNMVRGHFFPKSMNTKGYYLLDMSTINEAANDLKKGISQLLCLNDNVNIDSLSFVQMQTILLDSFEKRYPNKSRFEK